MLKSQWQIDTMTSGYSYSEELHGFSTSFAKKEEKGEGKVRGGDPVNSDSSVLATPCRLAKSQEVGQEAWDRL